MRKLKKIAENPLILVYHFLAHSKLGKKISDELYLKIQFFNIFHKLLNLEFPKTFSEKIQWMKLYIHHPEFTTMADKIEVKRYVSELLGENYVIPLLGIWDKFDEIDFDLLPNQFVLKTNHDSGNVIICKDKSKLNIIKSKRILTNSLNYDYYKQGREWPYKNIRRRIFAEQFLVDESGIELKDYKFFCFDGIVKFFKVDFNRQIEHHANYYDLNWKLLPFGEKVFPPKPNVVIEKPKNFEKMITVAEKLSKGIPFVRIDLYNINGVIKFGEMTFFPNGGFGRYEPSDADLEIGNMINLPERKIV